MTRRLGMTLESLLYIGRARPSLGPRSEQNLVGFREAGVVRLALVPSCVLDACRKEVFASEGLTRLGVQ
jgi:hypothetical protein